MTSHRHTTTATALARYIELVADGTLLCRVDAAKSKPRKGLNMRHLSRLDKKLSANHRGDAVIVAYCGDVCSHRWDDIARCPGGVHKPAVSVKDFAAFYREVVAHLRGLGLMPALLTLTPIDAPRYFGNITAGLDSENIMRWIGGDVRFVADLQRDYSEAIVAIASEMDVPLIDVSAIVKRQSDGKDLYEADGATLNREGEMAVRDAIRQFRF